MVHEESLREFFTSLCDKSHWDCDYAMQVESETDQFVLMFSVSKNIPFFYKEVSACAFLYLLVSLNFQQRHLSEMK